MSKIKKITCHKLVNSRGEWTIGAKVILDDGSVGVQTIPEGASKGENEANYLPADKAVHIVSTVINDALIGEDATDQHAIDRILIDMDGTDEKKHLGGNSILSVSLATSKAAARSKGIPLYKYISGIFGSDLHKKHALPTPVFNVLNGGKHAHNGLSFQEFMIIPSPELPYKSSLEIGVDIYHKLKKILIAEKLQTDVGDEGGFAPKGMTATKAYTLMSHAVNDGYELGKQVFFGMDAAAESFYKDMKYHLPEEELVLTSAQLSDYYEKLVHKFPLIYLEDPFYEKDYTGWEHIYAKLNKKLMIVGDDLAVTNPKILTKFVGKNLNNAVIVKPNQVGTLWETLEFIDIAQKNKMSICVSHRSGDTAEDTFIADLAVGVGAEFLKSGAPARGERVAKYNRLLEIYDELK